jgi:hypothetical protein
MTTSDHTPCVVSIKTDIQKSKIFCFANFWMEYDDFIPLVESVWKNTIFYGDADKRITAKFKALRAAMKKWSSGHHF